MNPKKRHWEKIVENRVKTYLKANKNKLLTHDFDHIKRVQRYALQIAEKEGGDKEIISLAALLHDIKTQRANQGSLLPPGVHGNICSIEAKKILKSIGYPEKRSRIICEIIREHEWSHTKKRSIESQIIYEADKIDGVGLFGVLRHMCFLGELGIPINMDLPMIKKRTNMIEKSFKTKTGKSIFIPKLGEYKKIFKKALKEVENDS